MTSNIIPVVEMPITRIRETCEVLGISKTFDRTLPDLETHLEGEVASGDTSEAQLTQRGLLFLHARFADAGGGRSFEIDRARRLA